VLESVKGKAFLSEADTDGLEAIARFVQGIEATCSDECSLDPLLVRARPPRTPLLFQLLAFLASDTA
jgi:hypothetical protein